MRCAFFNLKHFSKTIDFLNENSTIEFHGFTLTVQQNPFSLPLTLYFQGFRSTRTPARVQKHFEQFGALKKFVYSHKGVGRVEFCSPKSFHSCIKYFNGARYYDGEQPLVISISPPSGIDFHEKVGRDHDLSERDSMSLRKPDNDVSQHDRYAMYKRVLESLIEIASPVHVRDLLGQIKRDLPNLIPRHQMTPNDIVQFGCSLNPTKGLHFNQLQMEFYQQ